MNIRETEYKDKNGTTIRDGDVVEFFFSADYGYGDSDENKEYTKMVDLIDYDENLMVCTDTGRGCYIWRCNDECTVIGNVFENPSLQLLVPTEWIKDMYEKNGIKLVKR